MKSSHLLSKFTSLLTLIGTVTTGVLTIVVLTGGCAATATHESTGQYVDDSIVTTKVKSALLRDDRVKSFAVSVETLKGVVQLSGFVNTSDQKSAAGSDAWGVLGVKEVKNNLVVK